MCFRTARTSTARAIASKSARRGARAAGRLYDRLFVRHWDSWADGTRSQLFAYTLDEQGIAAGSPIWLTRGMDADVPSKPFGDDNEWSFTADSRDVIFAARIAGTREPWSTNFDLYRVGIDGAAAPRNLTIGNSAWDAGPAVSPDGRSVAYRAMKRAGFEADRFAILLKDLVTGETREVAPELGSLGADTALVGRWAGALRDGR